MIYDMGYFIYHNKIFRPNFFSPKVVDFLKHIFNHFNPFKKIIVAGTAHPVKFETNHYEIPEAHYSLNFEGTNKTLVELIMIPLFNTFLILPKSVPFEVRTLVVYAKKLTFF